MTGYLQLNMLINEVKMNYLIFIPMLDFKGQDMSITEIMGKGDNNLEIKKEYVKYVRRL